MGKNIQRRWSSDSRLFTVGSIANMHQILRAGCAVDKCNTVP